MTINFKENQTSIDVDRSNNKVSLLITTKEEDKEDKEIEKQIKIILSLDECQDLITYLKSIMRNVVENS